MLVSCPSFFFSFASLVLLHLGRLILLLLVVEGVGDFLASVEGAYQDEEGPASHDEAEGAGGCVAFVICGRGSVSSAGTTAYSVSSHSGRCNGRLGSAYSRSGGVGERRSGGKDGTYLAASLGRHRAPGSSTGHDPSASLVLFAAHTKKISQQRTKIEIKPPIYNSESPQLTFPSPIKLDHDLFIHILAQIQNILLLGLLRTLTVCTPSGRRSSSTASLTASPSSCSAPTASEVAPL